MTHRRILAFVGILLLSLCLFSSFQWLGVTQSNFVNLYSPHLGTYSWAIGEHVIGVRWGVVYGFGWRDGQQYGMFAPSGPISKVTHWGIVHPIEMQYHTFLGFSSRGEDGAYIGHGPYGLGQWSFPIWPLAAALLLPAAREMWKRFRDRRANRANLCSTCGYDLRASKERCPECGMPIPRYAQGRSTMRTAS